MAMSFADAVKAGVSELPAPTRGERLWAAACARLGCDDVQWQLRWRSWQLRLATDVDTGALAEHGLYVVYTTLCLGPLQIRGHATRTA